MTCLPTVVTGAAAQEDTRDREQQVTCWLPPRISRISGGCSGETPLYWLLFPIPTSLESGMAMYFCPGQALVFSEAISSLLQVKIFVHASMGCV